MDSLSSGFSSLSITSNMLEEGKIDLTKLISKITVNSPDPRFPKQLNMNETEALTNQKWAELFLLAVKNNSPSFVMAIARTTVKLFVSQAQPSPQNNRKGKMIDQPFYHCFDGVSFFKYIEEEKKKTKLGKNFVLLNPINKQPIKDIENDVYYVAMKCFELNERNEQILPKEQEFTLYLNHKTISLPDSLHGNKAHFNNWLFDGVNYHYLDLIKNYCHTVIQCTTEKTSASTEEELELEREKFHQEWKNRSKQMSQIQAIIGSILLENGPKTFEEGRRWLYSATCFPHFENIEAESMLIKCTYSRPNKNTKLLENSNIS